MFFNSKKKQAKIKGEYMLSHSNIKQHIKRATLVASEDGVELFDKKVVVSAFSWSEILGCEYSVQFDGVAKGVSANGNVSLHLKNGENVTLVKEVRDSTGSDLMNSSSRADMVFFEKAAKKFKIFVLEYCHG